ncbi:MAG: hypothetical protein A3K19_24900 [Lentisphaerae bacterium RIFOXYB12_FULL_65_16]|nr:MAG: hypothetical protein A3K18_24830 [Lentisphaerae bacterium RIFOXYA12_64_32]OGV90709.1 MAG: hypothetical protein A3K19_24900 [Lentisphaerae bacterium RIFOXYB12_FULL_65_16]
MLAKVFAKGQVVIPADVRRQFHVEVGDFLDIVPRPDSGCIELRRPAALKSGALGGSLASYRKGRALPSRKEMHDLLRKGIVRDAQRS